MLEGRSEEILVRDIKDFLFDDPRLSALSFVSRRSSKADMIYGFMFACKSGALGSMI